MQASSEQKHAPLLVHVGFHKTGSTWLQHHLFNNAACGFTNETGRPRHQIVHDFVRPDAFCFSARDTRSRYAPLLNTAARMGLTAVISHERFSGYPPSGGYDRRLIADRLAETFPEARILIVLREQRSLIRSMYSQYVTDGGDQSLKRFLETPEPALGRMPYFRFSFYMFHQLIAYYQRLFGADRVLALPFELFAEDRHRFLSAIVEFCGREYANPVVEGAANARRPILMQSAQRYANRFFSRNELSPVALFPVPRLAKRFGRLTPFFQAVSPEPLERWGDRSMRRRIDEIVMTKYADSNAISSRLIGIELSEFGYPCSD